MLSLRSLLISILFKVLRLLKHLLEDFLVPLRRVAVLIEQYGQIPVELDFDVVAGRPVCKLRFVVDLLFYFLSQHEALVFSIGEAMIVSHLDKNVIESLFFISDAKFPPILNIKRIERPLVLILNIM